MKKTLITILLASLATSAFAKQYWVTGVNENGGWVDVNKARNDTYGEYNGWFNNDRDKGDGFLCWAASASDIITWWHQLNPGAAELNPSAPAKQGEVWQLFKANFWNDSGSAGAGVAWYMQGVMPSVEPYPRNGAAPGGYYSDLVTTFKSYNITDFDPAFKYFPDAGTSWYLPDPSDPVVDVHKAIADEMSNLIDQGYIISLGIGGETGSKHAVTLWGLETDENGYLSKMWITDSDDWLNEYGPQEEPGEALIELICEPQNVDVTLGAVKVGEEAIYTITSPGTTYQGSNPNKEGRLWYSGEDGRTDYFYDFTAFKMPVVANQGVPEPTTGTLGLLALAGLAERRRRKCN